MGQVVYASYEFTDGSYENEAMYCMVWSPEGASVGADLGCGWRKAAPWLQGVDHHDGDWVEDGIKTHPSTPDVVADVRELPFADGSQDIVVSTHCLEHFSDPSPILQEWCRVLRVGGRMAIVVPDWRYTFSCTDAVQVASTEGHKMDYTLDVLVRVVMQALPNMELLDARVVNHHWSVGAALEKLR